MAKLTLDHLKSQAAERFDDLTVELSETEKLVFQHVMRLAKADRKKVLDAVDEITKDEADSEVSDKSADVIERLEKAYHGVLTAVADDKVKAKAVLKNLDVPQLTVLFESWLAGSKMGEASSSES
jgi:galactose-1-phosphate uridylyltransferase